MLVRKGGGGVVKSEMGGLQAAVLDVQRCEFVSNFKDVSFNQASCDKEIKKYYLYQGQIHVNVRK